MALYITTVEDICSDRNLAKTACTLCSDDLLILLLSDDSTDEWQELQMIAEKKRLQVIVIKVWMQLIVRRFKK